MGKWSWGILALIITCTSLSAEASQIGRQRRLGLGVASGNLVNGFSPKLYLRRDVAVQANIGVWGAFDAVGVNVDALYTLPVRPRIGRVGRVQFNVGGGALFYVQDGTANIPGVNFAFEIGLHLNRIPLEVITSWRPLYRFGLHSGTTPVQVGGAIRYYL